MIDADRQKWYDTMFELMAHPGWKLFVGDARRAVEMIKNALAYQRLAPEDVVFYQGQISQLQYVINLADSLSTQYRLELEQARGLGGAAVEH